MSLTSLDGFIVGLSLLATILPALWFARRGGSSTVEFFASGRSAPWWLIGVSMVATTFSTDTPNLVTNLVREGGVANNWVWWAFLLTGMATVFFYARLWRRLGVVTDLEFYELRYSGTPASIVRGFRAIYLGFFFNAIILASVNLAAAKIANVLLGWSLMQTLVIGGVVTVAIAAMSGLWGVLVSDFIQFGIAMAGSVAAAVVALRRPEVGGLDGLIHRLDPHVLDFFPSPDNPSLVVSLLVIPLAVQWWSVWYPGSEPGGGSYVAQRMLAARSERDALGGTLLFTVAHYALRPWPWILVALASLLVYPTLGDLTAALPWVDPALVGHDMAYPAMLRFLPAGLLGLMLAGLFAAYASTVSTHLNWGSSYLVHDLYRRFLQPRRDEAHYVRAGRVATVLVMVAAALITLVLDNARETFDLLLSVGAGTGLLYLLRWFWWRINAWSEIAAMAASFLLAMGFFLARKMGIALPVHGTLLASVGITTAVWIGVTLRTRPTDRETLERFYRLTRPGGPGWRPIRAAADLPAPLDRFGHAVAGWTAGVLAVYAALFATGSFLYGRTGTGTALALLAVAAGAVVVKVLKG